MINKYFKRKILFSKRDKSVFYFLLEIETRLSRFGIYIFEKSSTHKSKARVAVTASGTIIDEDESQKRAADQEDHVCAPTFTFIQHPFSLIYIVSKAELNYS